VDVGERLRHGQIVVDLLGGLIPGVVHRGGLRCGVDQQQSPDPVLQGFGGAPRDQAAHAVRDEHERPRDDGLNQGDEVGGHVVDAPLLGAAAGERAPGPVVGHQACPAGQQRQYRIPAGTAAAHARLEDHPVLTRAGLLDIDATAVDRHRPSGDVPHVSSSAQRFHSG
jgi:hypothetical protein